jgi:hypothetical protein
MYGNVGKTLVGAITGIALRIGSFLFRPDEVSDRLSLLIKHTGTASIPIRPKVPEACGYLRICNTHNMGFVCFGGTQGARTIPAAHVADPDPTVGNRYLACQRLQEKKIK